MPGHESAVAFARLAIMLWGVMGGECEHGRGVAEQCLDDCPAEPIRPLLREAYAIIGQTPPPAPTVDDVYRPVIAALREKGIEAAVTHTGGGCLALTWQLEDRYAMLTVAEPLPERLTPDESLPKEDPWWCWHLGIYPLATDGEVGGEPVSPVRALEQRAWCREEDTAMAEAVARHWDNALRTATLLRTAEERARTRPTRIPHTPHNISGTTETRAAIEMMDAEMKRIHDGAWALSGLWTDNHMPGDLFTPDGGYPFRGSLDEQVHEMYEYVPIDSGAGEVVVRHLREAGIPASWEYPGVVHFHTIDGFEWATGLTGWHVTNPWKEDLQFVFDDILALLEEEARDAGKSMPLLTLLDRIVGAINAYNQAASNR